MKRRHAVVLGVVFAEILFIIWFFEYLPMVDLPQHIFTAKVLTHFTDYDEFFTMKFPWNPYCSYFWFAMAFEPIMGIPNATRLYLSLALILTVVAFGAWLREVLPGRDAQMIPATLLLLGLFFYIGLVNYLFSVPFMFFSFALSYRLGKKKESVRSTEIWLALALLATYFSHVVTFAITLFVIGVQQLVIFRGRGLLRLIRASAPSIALLGVWMFLGLSSDVSGTGWSYDPFLKRLEYLLMPFNVFVDTLENVWVYHPRTVLSWIAFISVSIIGAIIGTRETIPSNIRAAALVAGLLVISTLFFPSWIASSSGALRLSYPAAFGLLALIPPGWDEKKALRWIVIAICVLNPLLLVPRIAAFQTEMAGLEKVIEAIPQHQVIQPVITEVHSEQFRTYPFLHSAAWYNYYKGGTNPYLFARVAHFPIKELRPFVPHPPGDWQAADFRYEQHQEGTDYFLVRTRDRNIINDLTSHVPLVAKSGDWMAFGPNPK